MCFSVWFKYFNKSITLYGDFVKKSHNDHYEMYYKALHAVGKQNSALNITVGIYMRIINVTASISVFRINDYDPISLYFHETRSI